MSHQIKICEFRSADMVAVVELLQSVSIFRPHVSELNELANEFIAKKDCFACVAFFKGKAIGFGSVFFLDRIRGGRAAIIEDVAVQQDFRGKGVGAMIVKELVNYSRLENCFKITLVTNKKNITFYEKLGFSEDLISMKFLIE